MMRPNMTGSGLDWDKLRVFHAVADAGSFTHAGEALHLSQSAVSRQVSALEERMGVPLFHRHARGLILTEQGELLYRTVHDVFAKLAMVEGQLLESKESPKGPLKVTTPVTLGSTWLAPRLKQFVRTYPDIDVSLILDDTGRLDLSMREADVALRLARPQQPDLIQRHLMTIHFHIYAHESYLAQRGRPETATDLDDHDLIIYGAETDPPVQDINFLAHVGAERPRRAILSVNNIPAMYHSVKAGMGIAALPDYIVERDSGVKRILAELEGPRVETFFVYAEELRHSKRIAVFRDFLITNINQQAF